MSFGVEWRGGPIRCWRPRNRSQLRRTNPAKRGRNRPRPPAQLDDAAPPPFITFDFGGFEQLGFTKARYSQIMADDEAATLSALKSCLSEVVEPCVSQHDGRIFKTMGDGFLAEFPSVVEAVACAGDIQRTMAARNLRTGTLLLLFRIGVHLGDVMAEGDDVFGDGVNVAARLQSLAEAGGVRISRQAYDHVEGKLGVTYRSLGDQRLKNIPRPIGVYAAEFGGDGTGVAAPALKQEIKYCRATDGTRLAYATVGQGPVLVKAANWLNHLELDWNWRAKSGQQPTGAGRNGRASFRTAAMSELDLPPVSRMAMRVALSFSDAASSGNSSYRLRMSRCGAGTQLSQTALFTFISCIVVTSSVVVTLALQDCCQQPQAVIYSFGATTGLVDTRTGLVGGMGDTQQLRLALLGVDAVPLTNLLTFPIAHISIAHIRPITQMANHLYRPPKVRQGKYSAVSRRERLRWGRNISISRWKRSARR